jgi:integrase
MRGSARHRGRGSWELTVDLGRDAGGKRIRRFRTVRGTRTDADRVLNGILRKADVGGWQLSPRLLLGDFVGSWLKELE